MKQGNTRESCSASLFAAAGTFWQCLRKTAVFDMNGVFVTGPTKSLCGVKTHHTEFVSHLPHREFLTRVFYKGSIG